MSWQGTFVICGLSAIVVWTAELVSGHTSAFWVCVGITFGLVAGALIAKGKL